MSVFTSNNVLPALDIDSNQISRITENVPNTEYLTNEHTDVDWIRVDRQETEKANSYTWPKN